VNVVSWESSSPPQMMKNNPTGRDIFLEVFGYFNPKILHIVPLICLLCENHSALIRAKTHNKNREVIVPVVWRWEHGYALPWVSNLITLGFHLMTAHYVLQFVLLQEALCNIRPKLTAHTPLTDGPSVLEENTHQSDTEKVNAVT